jgi:putative FmdB family regulatory protein
MPIYAYKCSSCGHAADVLQRMADAQLTVCPSCGQSTYVKQVTAAGFQLKGSGWYATDFRNNGAKPDPAAGSKTAETKPDAAGADSAKTDAPKTEAAKPDAVKSDSGSSPPPAPAPAPN